MTAATHLCRVEGNPEMELPAQYRPCPPDLCEAEELHNAVVRAREELRARKACLEGARDDLSRISKASVEDGGVWVRAVAEARLPLIEEAISNTCKALVALGEFNVCV